MIVEKIKEVSNCFWCLECKAQRTRIVTERIIGKDEQVVGEKGYDKCNCGIAPFAYGKSTGDVQLSFTGV